MQGNNYGLFRFEKFTQKVIRLTEFHRQLWNLVCTGAIQKAHKVEH